MKLPEPEGKIAYESDEYECVWISSQDAYTADQMRQVRIDTLEEAANAAHNCLNNYVFTAEMAGHAGYHLSMAEKAINALKEKKHE